MKKFLVFFCLLLSVSVYLFVGGQAGAGKQQNVRIYYTDRRLHKLIPTEYTPKSAKTQDIAREIIENIVSGKRNNPEILHLLPLDRSCISVKVGKNTATVNLSSGITDFVGKSPETERLIVYQIVNSLISTDGIDLVRFTIDGKNDREFFGYLDMREIFTPDYDT